jgi:hypothetical protein
MSVLSLRPPVSCLSLTASCFQPSASCTLPRASGVTQRGQLSSPTGWPTALFAFVAMPGKTGVDDSARKADGPNPDGFCS